MKWRPYARAALIGGAFLAAIEFVFVVAEFSIGRCCGGEPWAPDVGRISFLTHPMRERVFTALVVTFLDGEKRGLHTWEPTPMEALRDMILFFGLGFLEYFLYGLLLGLLVAMLFPQLRSSAETRKS